MTTWAGFSKSAYKAARSWDVQPSEFWRMSPEEWWWEFDMRVAENKRVRDMMDNKNGDNFTGPKWDEARRKHREKMNGRSNAA